VPLAIAERSIVLLSSYDLIVGAFLASLNSKLQIGKSYIIFGKTNNTAINLSAIGNNQIIQSIAIDIACVGD
jgi:hypothetical protein